MTSRARLRRKLGENATSRVMWAVSASVCQPVRLNTHEEGSWYQGPARCKSFCNGPLLVKSLRVIITPLGSCFCPWSAPRLPHHAISSLSRQVNLSLGRVICRSFNSTTPDLAKPSSQRPRRSSADGGLPRCLVPPLRGDGVLAPTELTDISQHAVKNGGELAGPVPPSPVSCRAASLPPSPCVSRPRTAWRASA